jgi:hypothetical protein
MQPFSSTLAISGWEAGGVGEPVQQRTETFAMSASSVEGKKSAEEVQSL